MLRNPDWYKPGQHQQKLAVVVFKDGWYSMVNPYNTPILCNDSKQLGRQATVDNDYVSAWLGWRMRLV